MVALTPRGEERKRERNKERKRERERERERESRVYLESIKGERD